MVPGRKPLYQAGFLVARRDPTVLKEVLDVILEGNYSQGYGRDNGWGNSGYGGLVGAMAMQGLMAYYYDTIRPNNAVELNQCRFNHMVSTSCVILRMLFMFLVSDEFVYSLPSLGDGCIVRIPRWRRLNFLTVFLTK